MADVRDKLTFSLDLLTTSFNCESLAYLAAWRDTCLTHSAVVAIRPRRRSTSRNLGPMAAKRLWRTAAATMAKSARRKERKGAKGSKCRVEGENGLFHSPPRHVHRDLQLSLTGEDNAVHLARDLPSSCSGSSRFSLRPGSGGPSRRFLPPIEGSGFFDGEADFPRRPIRRSHELADRLEYRLDLLAPNLRCQNGTSSYRPPLMPAQT